ncbi:MAG: hypothetical protein HOP19_14080 [Acidobacteria bacterium]|nr:hypothetical protein [Acidobacteriota bacterium]
MKRLFRQTIFCLVIGWCFALTAYGQTRAVRPIEFADIPATFHTWLKEQGITAESFAAYRQRIEAQTAERERRGEWEHLIYYGLQSSRFTKLPKIEPALSARGFAQKLKAEERIRWLSANEFSPTTQQLPPEVNARLAAFQQALPSKTKDERMSYFQQFTRNVTDLPAALRREYAATMQFLYQKEFQAKPTAAEIAALYQSRGHSTDTQIEANFAVHTILTILKSERPALKLNRVLIVGPGLDFAPRTDLLDEFEPQSYQPFAVADALLQLKLSDETSLQIDCADINDRVIAHWQRVNQRGTQQKPHLVKLLSGVADRAEAPLSEDFKTYFAALGKGIGLTAPLKPPAQLADHLSKSLAVRPTINKTIRALKLNVLTERQALASPYDLIIVTNVFPYFSDVELMLALTNLAKQLGETGYVVHNEPRATASAVTQALHLPLQHSRTVLIASGKSAPLYDFIAVHQKKTDKKSE